MFGSAGACFSLIGFAGGFESTGGTASAILNPFTFIGLAGIGAALFCIFMLIRGSMRK